MISQARLLKQNQLKKFRREFSAGGVVYKKSKNPQGKIDFLWLITKSTPSDTFPNEFWRLPKGWLDDAGEGVPGPLASGTKKATETQIQEAALREVKEEAGVNAKIIDKINTISYTYTDNEGYRVLKFVTFYLMEWIADLPEGFGFETSEVRWVKRDMATEKLSSKLEKQILEHQIILKITGFLP